MCANDTNRHFDGDYSDLAESIHGVVDDPELQIENDKTFIIIISGQFKSYNQLEHYQNSRVISICRRRNPYTKMLCSRCSNGKDKIAK